MPEQKHPTKFHGVATWLFIAGFGLGLWWLASMWPIFRDEGAAAMLAAGFTDWRLYATWVCLGSGMGLFAVGEKRLGKDPFKKNY